MKELLATTMVILGITPYVGWVTSATVYHIYALHNGQIFIINTHYWSLPLIHTLVNIIVINIYDMTLRDTPAV